MVDEEAILTKNLIQRPDREFIPTFLEWVPDGNVQQIFIHKADSGGALVNLYTVPKNFTLFITSAHLDISCTAAGPSYRVARLIINKTTNVVLSTALTGQEDNASATQAYPMPLRVDSDDIVQLSTSASQNYQVQIQGFLLPKKISIR